MHKLLKIASCCLITLFSVSVYANQNAWVAPVAGYINLQSSSANSTISEPIVTQPGGDPLTGINESQSFVARVVTPTVNAQQTVEVSLDGINWFTAAAVNGAYEYDFGLLAIGNYSLQIRIDGSSANTTSFNVTEYIPIPVSVDTLKGPGEVGVNQQFYITWDAVPGASSYNVINRYYNGTTDDIVGLYTGVTETTYPLSHNVAGNLNIRAQACNVSGCSEEEFWDVIVVKVKNNVPNVVSNVVVPTDVYVNDEFSVSWSAVSGANFYRVYADGKSLATATTTSAAITLTSPGSKNITVVACNATGCAAPSPGKQVNATLNPNAPIVTDDQGQLQVLTTNTFDVLANDYDPNSSSLRISQISSSAQKGNATIINNGKAISYTNTVGACGGVDSFTDSLSYKVSNAEGFESVAAKLDITVQCQPLGNWVQLPVPFNTLVKSYKLYAGVDDYYLKASPNSWLFVGKLMVPTFDQYSFIRMFKQGDTWQTELVSQAVFSNKVTSLAIEGAVGQITDLNAADWYSANINADLDIAPIAEDDIAKYKINTPLVIPVTANDLGPEPLYARVSAIITQPQFGQVVIDQIQNTAVYTPNTDSCVDDSFEYQITNNNQQQATAQVTLSCVKTAWSVASTMVGQAVEISWDEQQALSCGPVHNNDPAPGQLSFANVGSAEPLTFYKAGQVSWQCVDANNQVVGTSNVILTVLPDDTNSMPTVTDDVINYHSGTALSIDILDNDTAAGSFGINQLTFTQPQYGSVTVLNYQLIYTPNSTECVSDSFSYTISNDYGQASGQVTVNCSDTRWLAEFVTVGQPVQIIWDEPNAAHCMLSSSAEIFPSTGVEEFTFYSLGEVNWLCSDAQGQTIKTVTLTVTKLPPPGNLDKSINQ